MTITNAEQSPAELQAQAQAAYRASVDSGTPLSWQELGDMFGRSKYWARDRIKEAREESDSAAVAPPVGALSSDNGAGVVEPVTAVDDSAPVVAPTDAVAGQHPATVGQSPTVVAPSKGVAAVDTPDMSEPVTHHAGARFVCWLGFTLGTAVSVVANWLAAWLPAAQHAPGWQPDPWSQGFAAVWPVALLVSVEVLSRIAWPSGAFYGFVRYGGMVAVALSSGVISYGHIHAVLTAWGYGALGAAVGPLVIDGLMVVSGFGLLVLSKSRRSGDMSPI